MNIQHYEKGFEFSDRQLMQIARKVGKLATYCKHIKDESSSIRVESERRKTEKRRDRIKVAVTVELPKKILRSESRRTDPIEALDRCIEKIEPQVKKYKELQTGRRRSVK